jgi:branched-subunit amino acid transport protein
MIGLGLGPYIVAFFTDSVFQNEKAIRFSLTALFIIGGVLGVLFYSIGYRSYKKVMELQVKQQ